MYPSNKFFHMKTTMKTTSNLPVDLMDEVRAGYPGMTKTDLLIMGLKELKRQRGVENFISLRGKVNYPRINFDIMRDRKHYKWAASRKKALTS